MTAVSALVVRDEQGLAEHVQAWQGLARDALEPNAFHEPWLVLPALRAFGRDDPPRFVFVYGPTNPPSKQGVLLGVFPLSAPRRLSPFFPGRIVRTWRHIHAFLSTPLLHARRGGEALHAFFDWLASDREGAALWEMERVSADGPFARLLNEVMNERQRPCFAVESYCRAAIEPGAGDGDAYLKAALPHRRLKEYRRQERVLSGKGKFETRVLSPGDDPAGWVEGFLDLEASGWKGKEGTAMKNDPAHAAFFREMCRGAFERGRLLMLGLFLDGAPIALKCNLLAPPCAFAFKIAFDEAFARHSPGVLLEMANVEHLHAARPARWMDSCAVSGHFMINRLWTERRMVQTLLVSTGRAPGDLVVSIYPLARWLKRKFRRPPTAAKAPDNEEAP